MFGRRRDKPPRPAPQWTREKMLALLVAGGVTALILLFGLGLAVAYALQPNHAGTAHGGTGSTTSTVNSGEGGQPGRTSGRGQSTQEARDALAARPMPHVDDSASHPSTITATSPGAPIALPTATRVGPDGVPTGYPHTVEGALAQLAAIDQVAVQSVSVGTARYLIDHWALPGGPTGSTWSGVQVLESLLTDAASSSTGQLAIVLTPLMGEVKGTVGPDFVIPCVDFELDLTVAQTARGAVADCQRVVWQPDRNAGPAGGRWMVGPGAEPATPPSVWPDTDVAISVGYRDLRRAH
jgi:hypothetical protein